MLRGSFRGGKGGDAIRNRQTHAGLGMLRRCGFSAGMCLGPLSPVIVSIRIDREKEHAQRPIPNLTDP